ncbi:flavin-containing monooxygenase [Aquimarina brevivitae]|uniref:Putative flavoprotein involved in K+ transport n=1 Tax=Aquimarina brevivitae TaxID=323412 RepID=A0A4Q7P1X8_9FLAO|nr:NAD(P)/FAD-dependent oxidoreductase [Aquimarina brevivitae]RZS93338.1 putative flavoprotein involved in K+ transport [Aquimarina brevivitae]
MYDFVVIGGAQAGLAMAYHLKKMNKNFLVVDGEKEIGASWLNRWDSLRLFTPTEFNHLPGLKFNAPKGHYPTKFDVADYFKDYVATFNIPVQLNTLINTVYKTEDGFCLEHDEGTIKTKEVVVGTGPFHTPYTPPCHKKIAEDVLQMHSNYYKGLYQLQEGDALVVGGGDSGYQILNEISKDETRTVYFSGDTSVKSLPQQFLGKTIWWWFTVTGFLRFSKYSWIGKKLSKTTQPVIGTDVKEILSRRNVISVGRTKDALKHEVIFEKRNVSTIKNIIWATGYRPNFTWIEGLELDSDGYPKNYRGVSNLKGLYFIGLPWLYTRGSATLGGVSKDAEYLAKEIYK